MDFLVTFRPSLKLIYEINNISYVDWSWNSQTGKCGGGGFVYKGEKQC